MPERTRKLVTPGDILGVEEEFIPIHGAYVDHESFIRSQVVGLVFTDIIKKNIIVKHVKDKPLVPKQGDTVEGIVTGVSDDLAFINIYSINDKFARTINFTGVIHISQVSTEFLSSMYDALRLGEVVRAKVLNNNYPFQLTTKDPTLGVIVAYCSKCGETLRRRNDKLVCPRCGNVEKRKISSYYLFR